MSVELRQLALVGFNMGQVNSPEAVAPEPVFVALVRDALQHGYNRELGLMFTWLAHHSRLLNVGQIHKLIERSKPTQAELALWAAVGTWLGKDPRFGLLHKLYAGPRVTLGDPEIAEVLVRHHGEDPRFVNSSIILSAKALPERPGKDLRPQIWILRHNPLLANRLRFGPNYRADAWTALEGNPQIGVRELSRQTGCSLGTASQVHRDFIQYESLALVA